MPAEGLTTVDRPGRRIPRQTRGIHTRHTVIAAARAILIERGRDQVTTSKVAERAGVAVGTVYTYFSNRADIIAAIRDEDPLYQAHQELLTAAATAARSGNQSTQRRAEAHLALDTLIRALADSPEPFRLHHYF